MKRLLLSLSIISAPASAQSVTPNFTTGTMTQTVTATQVVNETIAIERFGGAVNVWNGDNVQQILPQVILKLLVLNFMLLILLNHGN